MKRFSAKAVLSLALILMLLVSLCAPAFAAKTVLSTQNLKVNGEAVDTEKYNIDDRNYFKLRDLAELLNGTESQFDVDYDTATNTMVVTTGVPYTHKNGTELKLGADKSETAVPSPQALKIDGEIVKGLTAYNIGDVNFFQLRELGKALGFFVDYDENTRTMLVSEITEADHAAADEVAALIDAIYVQSRTDETDAQCAAAKAAWDKLTDLQKELVEGEEADPDYFGRDTGDASLDDPRNADNIGEKEILVVSFGTSFNDSRVKDIKSIEDALAAAYPDWSVRRAFTAQIIINHIQARDGEKIDNMEQALERAVANGVKTLVLQPTHLMHGAEYDEMMEAAEQYKGKIEKILVAEPLLGEVGADATVINADKTAVAKALTAAAVTASKFDTLEAAAAAKTAFVFMGHGTSHTANITYSQMQTQMDTLGYKNVFIGTVEGKPASTACEAVIEAVKAAGYTDVILRPLMVVAGDHANNDMADPDDEESWYSQFTAAGLNTTCQIEGLGRIADVAKLYVEHTAAVTGETAKPEGPTRDLSKTSDDSVAKEGATPVTADKLKDGTYDVTVNTGAKMFKVTKADLTVKDGKMSAVIALGGTGYTWFFVGEKEAIATADESEFIPFVEDADGYYTFEIPVEALDQVIPCAAYSANKNSWYPRNILFDAATLPEGALK